MHTKEVNLELETPGFRGSVWKELSPFAAVNNMVPVMIDMNVSGLCTPKL